MRRIRTYFSIIILLVSAGLLTAQEELYFEKNQDKIQAIEKLWLEQGIPVIINEWAKDDSLKISFTVVFKEKFRDLIYHDRKEFFSFANDPKVSYPELERPRHWLKDKNAAYMLRLNEEYTKWSGGGPGIPGVVNFYGGKPLVIPYDPNPLLTPQCVHPDIDSALEDWSTDTGYMNGALNPLYNSYTPAIGTYDPLKKIQSYNNPGYPYDLLVGGTALPKIYPGSSNNWSVKLENNENGNGLSHISRHFTVDVNDPWIVYRYAVVLQDPGDHADNHRPFFEVRMTDSSDSSIDCAYYRVIAKPPIEGFVQVPGTNFYWRDWTSVIIPLDEYAGTDVTLHFTVGDCALGGHLGYAYIDAACLDDDLVLDALCDPDQLIIAPKGFDFYHWTGEDIPEDNYRNSLVINKAGTYKVDLITVTGCEVSREIVVPFDCPETPDTCTLTGITTNISDCDEATNTYTINGQVTIGGVTNGYLVVTAGNESKIYPGPFSGPVLYSLAGLPANGQAVPLKFRLYTSRHLSSYTLSCEEITGFEAPEACGSVSFVPCEDCLKGFEPGEDRTYVVSTWVKKDSASALDYEYTDPFVKIGLYDGSTWTYHTFYAEGDIIDGWQRISEEFFIPVGTEQISVQLGTSTQSAYFDDLRLYPSDGSFKTFVYDPINLRLVAELDENNYATFYEYDEEGALVRIKKETERGVMTIQENRNYQVKKP